MKRFTLILLLTTIPLCWSVSNTCDFLALKTCTDEKPSLVIPDGLVESMADPNADTPPTMMLCKLSEEDFRFLVSCAKKQPACEQQFFGGMGGMMNMSDGPNIFKDMTPDDQIVLGFKVMCDPTCQSIFGGPDENQQQDNLPGPGSENPFGKCMKGLNGTLESVFSGLSSPGQQPSGNLLETLCDGMKDFFSCITKSSIDMAGPQLKCKAMKDVVDPDKLSQQIIAGANQGGDDGSDAFLAMCGLNKEDMLKGYVANFFKEETGSAGLPQVSVMTLVMSALMVLMKMM